MVNLYLYFVSKFNIISITHKFLIVDYTQNESDNGHSLFKKQTRRSFNSGPIYTPSQYITLIQIA